MRVREVVAIRHLDFEHLGSLEAELEGRGFRVRYLQAGLDDLAALDPLAADLLVLLGGPIGANDEALYPWLSDELRLVEARLAARRPLLGICLGAQLMARALGARVHPGVAKEIGWGRLELNPNAGESPLTELSNCGLQVLHWHGDTFSLPAGVASLASTAITPNQAFAVGRHALALQFHIELKADEIERWLLGHAFEIALSERVEVAAIRADTERYGVALEQAARRVLGRWLQQAGLA